MKRFLSILLIYMRAEIRTEFQYRAAWWVDMVGFVIGYGTRFLLLGVLVSTFNDLNGWKPYEVMLLYAIALCSYTIAQAFASTFMWMVPNKIRMGDFDHTLTRPMPPMLYEIATGFSGYYFWHFILTFFMIGICVVNLGIQLTFVKLLTFAVLVLGAMWVQAATIILFSAASFWLIGDNPLSQIYMEVRAMAEYPISIYAKAVQVFLTVVLPFGFIAFYPAQYFLGKSDYLMFGPWVQYASPAIGLVMLVIATLVWNFAVKHYSSSGS